MECSGNFARESMEGIEDQWVQSRGRVEFISERGINQVDEEFVREEGDSLIVHIRRGNVIWSVRQGVRSTEILAWNVLKGKIEFRQVEQPSGLSMIQITRLMEVGQVLVVCKDLDCGGGTEKVVAPGV